MFPFNLVIPSLVFVIVFCLSMFITNILLGWRRTQGLNEPNTPQAPKIPQMKMMRVHIPFTFQLQEPEKSSYRELKCKISSRVGYKLETYWGVSIREMHLFLWKSWSTADERFSTQNGSYQQRGLNHRDDTHEEKIINLSLTEGALDLGSPPRIYYPLVVFLIRENPENLHVDETVALIIVVHIKDEICTLPTSVLTKYLKQANGQLSCLKQLYLASGNPLGYESGLELLTGGGEQLCVVCQYYPLSRALLPCRHTCVCASCFVKLDSCPMCRSSIVSYFCVRGEDYMN